MDYLVFDLLVAAIPAAFLVRRPVTWSRAPVLALAILAVLWTAPWDSHLVRTGVWAYDPGAVVGRIGVIPIEEYVFVVLQVLLVASWADRIRAIPLRPVPPSKARALFMRTVPPRTTRMMPLRSVPPRTTRAMHLRSVPPRGATRWAALGWCGVTAAGLALLLLGGHLRYLGLLLVWAGPPLALQRAVAGDVLAGHRMVRLRTAVPTVLWLCAADRLALAHGIWTIAPGSSTGLTLVGLPVEEALFFGLTCLLVTDGLLLASDPVVLLRCRALLRGRALGQAPVDGLTMSTAAARRSAAEQSAGPVTVVS